MCTPHPHKTPSSCSSGCGCATSHHFSSFSLCEWSGVLLAVVFLCGVFFAKTYAPSWSLLLFLCAYISVSVSIFRSAWQAVQSGSWFNEFTLMIIATLGAFAIGEYPEAVAVMLFYRVGEGFQTFAVGRARRSIAALADLRPDRCTLVLDDGTHQEKSPRDIRVGQTLWVERGARVPLDGTLLTPSAAFNTAALTGESKPRALNASEEVLAGMIAMDRGVHIAVVRPYGEDALSRILRMVEEASARKAPTEQFITRFARVYTPIVVSIAALLAVIPALLYVVQWMPDIQPQTWLYRALVFLVVSCPCALVLSIPLSYFHGIGRASQRGILFKGSNYLDAVRHLDTIVFDKTGTLTEGIVRVEDGVDSGVAGAFTVENDHPKPSSAEAVATLRRMGLHTVMLSGDYAEVVDTLAQELGLDEWHAQLLPADKLAYVEDLLAKGRRVAFVGDGVNDAPVLSRATVGFAMGAKGTDAAVDTADVVLSTDDPAAIATAIRVGRSTHRLVVDNIVLALGFKILVLLLSAFGIVGMWGAVLADTGVVVLCVLNVLRRGWKQP